MAIATTIPASCAFCKASIVVCSILPSVVPVEPRLMLILSTPIFTASSIALLQMTGVVPILLSPNTLIIASWASGATPFSFSPFAATIPATCIPCDCTLPSFTLLFLSAQLNPKGIFLLKYFPPFISLALSSFLVSSSLLIRKELSSTVLNISWSGSTPESNMAMSCPLPLQFDHILSASIISLLVSSSVLKLFD